MLHAAWQYPCRGLFERLSAAGATVWPASNAFASKGVPRNIIRCIADGLLFNRINATRNNERIMALTGTGTRGHLHVERPCLLGEITRRPQSVLHSTLLEWHQKNPGLCHMKGNTPFSTPLWGHRETQVHSIIPRPPSPRKPTQPAAGKK